MSKSDTRLDACECAMDDLHRRLDSLEARGDDGDVRVVYNKLLGGWYVVRGPHQTPLSGRFSSKEEAKAWLDRNKSRDDAVRTDPPVSERQRRAMRAASGGKSNLGIPQSVGKEFSEADPGGKLPEHARDDGWSDEAREAAAEARKKNGGSHKEPPSLGYGASGHGYASPPPRSSSTPTQQPQGRSAHQRPLSASEAVSQHRRILSGRR